CGAGEFEGVALDVLDVGAARRGAEVDGGDSGGVATHPDLGVGGPVGGALGEAFPGAGEVVGDGDGGDDACDGGPYPDWEDEGGSCRGGFGAVGEGDAACGAVRWRELAGRIVPGHRGSFLGVVEGQELPRLVVGLVAGAGLDGEVLECPVAGADAAVDAPGDVPGGEAVLVAAVPPVVEDAQVVGLELCVAHPEDHPVGR